MSDDFTKAAAGAIRATRAAKSLFGKMNHPDKPRPNKALLDEVREADAKPVTPDREDPNWPIKELKIKVVSTLLNIRKLTPGQIDTLLHFSAGTTTALVNKYPKEMQYTLREDVDTVLDRFLRNKISVLESLMAGAPNTVRLLVAVQADELQSLDARLKAGDKILDWTKMILNTKTPEKTKRVLSEDLRQVADEADAAMEMLESILGGAVDGSQN